MPQGKHPGSQGSDLEERQAKNLASRRRVRRRPSANSNQEAQQDAWGPSTEAAAALPSAESSQLKEQNCQSLTDNSSAEQDVKMGNRKRLQRRENELLPNKRKPAQGRKNSGSESSRSESSRNKSPQADNSRGAPSQEANHGRSKKPSKKSATRNNQSSRQKRLSPDELREMHFFMRLARQWDLRFELLFRTGKLSKWYSSVGNEGITVPAASAIEAGDALFSLHRDSGAILRYYLDSQQIGGGLTPKNNPRIGIQANSRDLLHRLACQMLGKGAGYSGGYERSYHYGLMDKEIGCHHMGMISHLGAMIPVAAGAAHAFQQQSTDRVAINFIGDGGVAQGDFHETLNMAALYKLPFILIIENNQFAFSTPNSGGYSSDTLAERAHGYGMPGYRINGNNPLEVLQSMRRAVKRARAGEGPTLIEAMVGRMRGHSEGDDSIDQVSEEEKEKFLRQDPLLTFEDYLIHKDILSEDQLEAIESHCSSLMIEVVDKAMAEPEPALDEERAIYAD